jgi:predicted amidophosphoribosyltransferase
MSLNNCKNCGKLYVKSESEYCVHCQDLNNQYYRIVRDFLKDNPHSSVMEVYAETGIPLSLLTEIYKENSLVKGI